MRAIEDWSPSKFVFVGSKLTASRDPGEIAPGSRVAASAMATLYHRALQAHAKGRLLDLGCGKVPLFQAYRDRVNEVVCVDWNSSLHGSRHVDHFRDLNTDLDLGGKPFDTVLLSDVLEHIRSPDALLERVFGVMSTGGKLIIGVPFMYRLHEEPHDYYRYTRHALDRLVSDAGFKTISLEESGGVPEVLLDIIGKSLHRRRGLQRAFLAAGGWAMSRSPVQRYSSRTKATFPLGYVVVAEK